MHRVGFLFIFLIHGYLPRAQWPTIPPVGPKALGAGAISVTNADHWSVFNNPGGLAEMKSFRAFASYQSIFDFSPFNTVSVGFVLSSPVGQLGLGLFRFGDDLFNTQQFSLAIARKVGIMQLGIRLGYLQLSIEGIGSRGLLVADIGGIAQLTPELRFGAHIHNFSQSIISPETQERAPSLIRLGLAYEPTDAFSLMLEAEKDVDLRPDIKLGLQYQLIDKLHLRTGFSGLNNSHTLGAGLKLTRFIVDYALLIDRDLGHTHNFGITFSPTQ